jgi:hypothetical protein
VIALTLKKRVFSSSSLKKGRWSEQHGEKDDRRTKRKKRKRFNGEDFYVWFSRGALGWMRSRARLVMLVTSERLKEHLCL